MRILVTGSSAQTVDLAYGRGSTLVHAKELSGAALAVELAWKTLGSEPAS